MTSYMNIIDPYIMYFVHLKSIVLLFSNASVCGAVLGCKLGYSKLPKDLLELKYKSWLDEKVTLFLRTTGLLD